MKSDFSFVSSEFPKDPGVYLMKDGRGRIIYVGKAKSLRKRLASYFASPEQLTPKTRALVGAIRSIDTLITGTEKEALLLESSLIKKHKPRYNIILRDDKQYLLFKLDLKSEYPRLSVTRRVVRDGSVYFGPFTSASDARTTFKAVGRVFPIRKCRDAVFRNRVRPCLYHDMGQCLAPCVLSVPRGEYKQVVSQVELFLRGNSDELVSDMTETMMLASDQMDFERAALIRDRIAAIRRTMEKQTVVLSGRRDIDVIAPAATRNGLTLGTLFIRGGKLIGQEAFSFPGIGLDEARDAVLGFLLQYYGPYRYIPHAFILPWELEDDVLHGILEERRGGSIHFLRPRNTGEKRLLDMARKNAAQSSTREQVSLSGLLAKRLRLSEEPLRVECVDISHLGGTQTRAGVVVWEEGEMRKDAYRVYSLPETEGSSDDYGALAEWVGLRLESGPPWPDLLLIDGGRGQLRAVERTLAESDSDVFMELASICKGERRAGELEDVIYRPGRKNPVPLKPGSRELLFLQMLRDAAHDFSIGRQRRARKSAALQSEVLSLPGVGEKTAALLWETFGSIEKMAGASLDELARIPGIGGKKAKQLHEGLSSLMQ